MTNFTPIFAHQSFNPEQVKTMSDVYDLVIKNFPADDHEYVALAVLAAARTGEKDRDRLCDLVLLHLSADEPKYDMKRKEA